MRLSADYGRLLWGSQMGVGLKAVVRREFEVTGELESWNNTPYSQKSILGDELWT
jgi:hypothetical protein